MDSLVNVKNGRAVVSSKHVADKFDKVHRHVLESIRNMECSDKFRGSNFVRSSYTSRQNKVLPCYEITRDGFAFLCMGFTGKKAAKWKERYIQAFNSMDAALHSALPLLDKLNELSKIQMGNKSAASEAGRVLAKYKKVKRLSEDKIDKAYTDIQLVLGF